MNESAISEQYNTYNKMQLSKKASSRCMSDNEERTICYLFEVVMKLQLCNKNNHPIYTYLYRNLLFVFFLPMIKRTLEKSLALESNCSSHSVV